MTTELRGSVLLPAAGLALAWVIAGAGAYAQQPSALGQQDLPNMGQQITPLAPLGSRFESLNPGLPDRPDWLAGQAVTSVVSPDHKTLLVLTSGYNRAYRLGVPAPPFPWFVPDSNEYVFIYDISTPTPVKKQPRCRSQIPIAGLRSIHRARPSTWPAAAATMCTSLR